MKNSLLLKKLGLTSAHKEPFPTNIKPMLATLIDVSPPKEDWIYEIKWDGYRALAFCNKNNVNLISRNNKSFNDKFYPIISALQELKLQAVLDGEIVVLKESGVTSFSGLQNWRSEADGELAYYIFDILWLNGFNLMNLPLIKRKEILKSVVSINDSIKLSETFDSSRTNF